jgi:hypothetical protein
VIGAGVRPSASAHRRSPSRTWARAKHPGAARACPRA